MNKVFLKEQPAPRKEQADRMFVKQTGFEIKFNTNPLLYRIRRCFRYLGCFNGGVISDSRVRRRDKTSPLGPTNPLPLMEFRPTSGITFKAAYLSSLVDRILSLNKATNVSSGAWGNAPCPVGVCRIDWAAQ